MSIQLGKHYFDGKPAGEKDLAGFPAFATLYGADRTAYLCQHNVCIAYGAFYTTKESSDEAQPHVLPSGAVLTWDGRLDNRDELVSQLGDTVSRKSSDVAIVGAAYEHWRRDCFGHLIGDWALSLWIPNEQTVILAKDFLGNRQLYYRLAQDHISWSTLLDPLLTSGTEIELNEEYIAGWLGMFPAAHLTPYRGVDSVPPSSYVLVRGGSASTTPYWDFDPNRRIRYRMDSEYEEHFRMVFAKAVGRRLRSQNKVIAELSGGMDSSSIVCMADLILSEEGADLPPLETVSYYDDAEPNWNELPYFTKVEEKRGRAGCHIDIGRGHQVQFAPSEFAITPGSQNPLGYVTEQVTAYMNSQQSRVLLSGIGGDEVTGGLPTPVPELTNLISRGQFCTLGRQLKLWAITQRQPWFHLLFETMRGFLPVPHLWVSEYARPASWVNPEFVHRYRSAIYGYPTRLKPFGPLPSFQEDLATLNFVRRHLSSLTLPCKPHYEKRYPYLDRDLLEFLYAIPREQLVRPGHRRSLMRRALVGIVPDEILNRKRKAYVVRRSNETVVAGWNSLCRDKAQLATGRMGIILPDELRDAVERVRQGRELSIVPLFRILAIEAWLSQFPTRKPFRLTDGHAPEALVYTRSAF